MSRTTTCTFRVGLAIIENSDCVVVVVRCVVGRNFARTCGPKRAPLTSTPTTVVHELRTGVATGLEPAEIWMVIRRRTASVPATARQTIEYWPAFLTLGGTMRRTIVAPAPARRRHV